LVWNRFNVLSRAALLSRQKHYGGFHMHVTSDQAVVMFARYCRARFGTAASRTVRAKAKTLRKRGDFEGHDVWNRVADEIDQRNHEAGAQANQAA